MIDFSLYDLENLNFIKATLMFNYHKNRLTKILTIDINCK